MKLKFIKRLLSFVCSAVFVLLLSACGSVQEWEEPEALSFDDLPVITTSADSAAVITAAENERMRLMVNPATASVYVEDVQTGTRYPLTVDAETIPETVDGAQKMLLQSMLQVTAMDAVGKEFVVNSCVGSVNKGTFTIYDCGDGVILDYRFERPSDQYAIPVRIRLTEDGFSAEILYNGIREWGEMRINRIALLPAFGAQVEGTEGYMLIPDGSGALVPWKAAVGNPADYYADVYERDPALSLVMQTEVRQAVRMPIFGAKAGDTAFLGIITAGDAGTAIHCSPAKQAGQFGRVYASFVYRQSDTSILADKDWNSREVTVMAERCYGESPCITYCLLSQEKADYSGMANRYRRYLTEETGLTKTTQQTALLLEMPGAYARSESVFGFAVEFSRPATTFRQAEDIVNAFVKAGISDLSIVYTSVNQKGQYRSQAGSFEPDGVLGGAKGLEELAEYCADQEIELTIELDVFSCYTKTEALFQTRFAKRINDEPVKLHRYSLATNQAEDGYFRYLTRAENWLEDWKKMIRIPTQIGLFSYAPVGLGEWIYADHTNGEEKNRDDMRMAMTELAQSMTEDNNTRLLISGGNVFMLEYASGIRDVPVVSSAFDLQSEAVPFYAMVTHGLLPLYSESLTGKSNLTDWGLVLAESGVMPQFLVTGNPPADFLNSEQNETYASYYADVLADVDDMLEWLQPLLEPVWDQAIVRHSRIDGLSVTEYENGVKIVTNFTQEDRVYQGTPIPARSSRAVDRNT